MDSRKGIAAAALASIAVVIGLVVGVGALYVAAPTLGLGTTSTTTKTFVTTNTVYSTQTTSVVSVSTIVSTSTQVSTNTQFITNTQYSTEYTTVMSVSSVESQGTQSLLSSATEVIPNGDTGIAISGWSFPYPGYLIVSYTASNTVNLSYTYGSTTVSTPNAETETGLTMPVRSGSLVFSINNQACTILGCPSITMTLTVTYYYGY